MPEFKELEAFLRSDTEALLITFPEGTTEVARDEHFVGLEGPDESKIRVSLSENEETAVKDIANEMKRGRRRGSSTLECGGTPVHTELYSMQMKGEGTYAVLVASWEKSGAVVMIAIPSSKYAQAGGWIKEMLCSVERIE